jgi:hypothetical protein
MATRQRQDDGGVSVFATDPGYRPPSSAFRRFIWKWRMWFESTLALSMLEGWEKVLIGASPSAHPSKSMLPPRNLMMYAVALMAMFWGLLITGIYRYLPYHLQFLYQRAIYYLSGTEQKDWSSARGFGATVLSTRAPHVQAGEF